MSSRTPTPPRQIPMPDPVETRNIAARARAQKAGRPTYQCDVIETWPACTKCGDQIRHRGGSAYRTCGCPGTEWVTSWTTSRWERR